MTSPSIPAGLPPAQPRITLQKQYSAKPGAHHRYGRPLAGLSELRPTRV